MRKRHEEPTDCIVVQSEKKRRFELFRWREAFKHFFEEILSEHFCDQECVTIHLSRGEGKNRTDFYLRYLSRIETYEAWGYVEVLRLGSTECPEDAWMQSILYANGMPAVDFERALGVFIRSRRYKAVTLSVPRQDHLKHLIFWNKMGHLQIGKAP